METKTTYFPIGTIFIIFILVFLWLNLIMFSAFDFADGISKKDIFGVIVGLCIALIITIILLIANKDLSAKIFMNKDKITLKKGKTETTIYWSKVVYLTRSTAPNYLYGESQGYGIHYIENGVLCVLKLIATKQIKEHLLFLEDGGIITIE